jgi:hypothetical protein
VDAEVKISITSWKEKDGSRRVGGIIRQGIECGTAVFTLQTQCGFGY